MGKNHTDSRSSKGNLFVDSSGNSYVASRNTQLSITKYDATGTVVWTRTGSSGTGIITPNDIAVDASGNYYVTGSYSGTVTFGSTTLTNSGLTDIFVVKYSSTGTVLWASKEGGTNNDVANSIALDHLGNCYLTGSFTPVISGQDIYYAKFNASGVLQWTKRDDGRNTSGFGYGEFDAVSVDSFGNTYCVGKLTTASSSYIQVIRKCDPAGNRVWQKEVTGVSRLNDIVTDSNGNSYVTGYGGLGIYIAKYDAAGQQAWAKSAGSASTDIHYSNSIALDAQGNCYITGVYQQNATFDSIAISNLNSGVSDIFVAKYNNLGDVVWVQTAGVSGVDAGYKIGVDAAGNCFLNGIYSYTTSFGTNVLDGVANSFFLARIGNAVEGNAIFTGSVGANSYNAGEAVSVSFTKKGTFASGTIYNVQLSDPTGSFFNSQYMGSGTISPIKCVIPVLSIPAANYRVRVIATNPTLEGTDNGSNITINGNSQLLTPQWAWAKNIPAVRSTKGNLFVDSSGNSYIATPDTQLSITKYDATGTVVWTRTGSSGTGIISPNDIAVDASGNYYVTGSYSGTVTFGSTTLTNSGLTDIFVVKYSSTGTVLWASKEGGTNNDVVNSIAVDQLGNCYLTGSFTPVISGQDIYYAKFNASGVLQWTKRDDGRNTSGFGYGEFDAVSVDSFGNTYYVGKLTTASSSYIQVIRKCDPAGNRVWQKEVTGVSKLNDIVSDSNGNSYVTGWGGLGIFIAKYDAAGQQTWSKSAGSTEIQYGNSIVIDAQGNSYVTGIFKHSANFSGTYISNPNSGVSDVCVAKYDTSGNLIWVQQAGASGIDAGYKIGIDALGNSYISGLYSNSVNFGKTTLSGVENSFFLAKIGTTYITSVENALVKGDNFCGGAVITVDYAIIGKFNTGNVFTAQLSNASGSFSNPTTIGTLASTLNTSIYAIVPSDIPVGSGYRIRVISSSPALVGTDNGLNINLNQTNCVNNTVVLTASPIVAVEYFIDTDPGVGLGTPISTAGGMSIALNTNIQLPTLTAGFHNLFMRSKDAKGDWSLYEGRVFYVQPTKVVLAITPIATAEYFFDTDPGVGKATALTSFTSANDINLNRKVSVTGLTSGFHNLFIRTKDTKGKWSMYEGRIVYIQPNVAPVIAEPIVSGEYFFDKDLGVGAGIPINTGAETVSLSLNLPSVATSPLLSGTHNVFIRVKNKAGKWSTAERREFNICSSVLASPLVTGTPTLCSGSTLNLSAGNVSDATSYTWTGPNGFTATTQSISVSATTALQTGLYTVAAVNGTTGCGVGNPTKVNVVINETPVPTGLINQTLASGKTVTDIVVTGTGVKWYNSASDASAGLNPILSTTVLQNAKTYYATQTLNGCKSNNSLAVTIATTLAVGDFDNKNFTYYPNPVSSDLNISNTQEITSVKIYNIVGQLISENQPNATSTIIDMSGYKEGFYFIELKANEVVKIIKISKTAN